MEDIMKVGINLPSQFPFGSTAQMLEVYEQVGFDSYWSPDHILGVFHPGLWSEIPLSDLAADPDAFYDPFCYGAVVGTMTDKPFGISVTDATRRGAADLARTALTLNDLNPGRVHPRNRIGRGGEPGAVRLCRSTPGVGARARPARPALAARPRRDGRRWCRTDGPPTRGRGTRQPSRVGGRSRTAHVAAHRGVRRRVDSRVVDEAEEYGEKRKIIADHAAAAGRPAPVSSLLPFVLFAESRDAAAEMFERSRSASCSVSSPWATCGRPTASSTRWATTRRASST
jgi:phthiodiolone/phenolphthiodiolone dimycocerosates ketoreductase